MRIHYRRKKRSAPDVGLQYRANESIRVPEVRVIGSEGEVLGVMPTRDAIARARDLDLDLVEVAPNANPPVCRIQDYGQFKYQKEKEHKAKKVHARKVEVKGVRLSAKMGQHDMDIRLAKAKSLDRGHKTPNRESSPKKKAHGDIAINALTNSLTD